MTRQVPDQFSGMKAPSEPQHFSNSLRLETLIQALPARYFPFYWGVRAFDYEPTDFTVASSPSGLDAVMPTVFTSCPCPNRIGCRSIAAVRGNVAAAADAVTGDADQRRPYAAATQRFFSEGDAVADENTGGVRSRFRGCAAVVADCGTEPPRAYQLSADRGAMRRRTFLPTEFVPTLVVAGTSPIGRKCAEISEHLRKAVQMAERAI